MASYKDKLDRIISTLEKTTGLSNIVPGSKAYQLAEAVAYEQMLLEGQIEDLGRKNSIARSSGGDLDNIGENFFNIKRLGEIRPYVSSSMKIIKFYVENGTFGSINVVNINGVMTPQDIIIPEGTSIFGTYNGIEYRFRVSETTTLGATESFKFVSAELIQGSYEELPANILTTHNFTNFASNLKDSLKVTNVSPITTGRTAESDENYRYRIVNAQNAFTKTTTISIHRLLTEIPGVSNVYIEPATSGGGTFTAYVQGTTPITGDDVIEKCKLAVSQIVSPWQVSYDIVKPNYIGIEADIVVTLPNNVDKTAIASLIRDRIIEYINNLYTDQFYINSILGIAAATSPNILGVNFNYVRIYRGDEEVRSFQEVDFSTNSNPILYLNKKEKLVVEPSSNPIIITV